LNRDSNVISSSRHPAGPRPASRVGRCGLGLIREGLKDIGDGTMRVTYDNGRMEIMSPLPEHERPKKIIGRMIESLTFELDRPMVSLGSTTFRRKDRGKGLEPDECYYFRDEEKMRAASASTMKKDPSPELVVEIDVTIDRFRANRSMPRSACRKSGASTGFACSAFI